MTETSYKLPKNKCFSEMPKDVVKILHLPLLWSDIPHTATYLKCFAVAPTSMHIFSSYLKQDASEQPVMC